MKQQQHDIKCKENVKKKSESHTGFEPMTVRDLVGRSNHWATGDSTCMVSKGQFVGLNWNHIVWPSNDWHTHIHTYTLFILKIYRVAVELISSWK